MTERPFDERKSIAYVLESSQAARTQTAIVAPGIRQRTEPAIECLLKIVDCVGPQPENEHASAFQWWAWSAYLSAGHTSVALSQLLGGAFYLEASILLRQLTEVLVQLRYFEIHKDQLMTHLTATRARDRVAFRTMFEAIAPGYYADYYSLASGFAHGGIASTMLRLRYMTPTSGTATFGCQFSEDNCTLVANTWAAVLHGFLASVFPSFPNTDVDENGRAAIAAAHRGLDEYLHAHWFEHAKAHTWLQVLGKLVRWTPPAITA
jgi:hypothetical protein